jgi:flagellar biosynthesis protein FlhF
MMRMHSFSGTTSREVLQKVKQALGDDALIISNREVDGRIEVVALAAAEAIIAGSTPDRETRSTHVGRAVWGGSDASVELEAPGSRAFAGGSGRRSESGESLEDILSEIQNLKSMLRQDRASLAAAQAPQRRGDTTGDVYELEKAGFTPDLMRQLDALGTAESDTAAALNVATRLQTLVKVAQPDELVERGGVYALVGPTGVGKTTTVAKLAARCVVRFGAAKIALLTTDGYRIGGYDQLRIYARILGVTVHAVRDTSDLATALAELSGRHLILIDTIGMSHRDRMVAEQAAMLAGAGDVKRLLLVQATTNTATLDEIVRAYKAHGVHGCIITKTDEAAALAPALDGVIRHELAIHYVTDGQRVPEDLQLPDAEALVREALQPAGGIDSEVLSDGRPSMPAADDNASIALARLRVTAAGEIAPAPVPKVMRPLGRHAQMRVVHG